MSVEFCVVSIGALSRNRLWGEPAAMRTAHATTVYIEEGSRCVVVDPSLPVEILAARLNERTGKTPEDITDVLCTTLRPTHRRGIDTFPNAAWWTGDTELKSYRRYLEALLNSADRLSSEDASIVRADLEILDCFRPSPEKFGRQISLYPLPGASAGSVGLLLTPATMTIAIAGDAALTAGHVRRGQVWEGCAHTEAAAESLRDLLEIADVIIPGHDNVMITAQQRWF